MIVIATNNGNDHLPNLLKSLEETNKLNIPISIIDTGSTDKSFINYLKNLPPQYKVYKSSGGYDSGAYIYAYKNIESDFYIFIQDSITILSNEFFNKVLDNIKDSKLFAFHVFESWEGAYTCEHILPLYFGKLDIESFKWGVFGPMFACSKNVMEKIYNSNLWFIPKNKEEQMAMERGWGIIACKLNIPLVYLDHYRILLQNKSPYIKKHFLNRH